MPATPTCLDTAPPNDELAAAMRRELSEAGSLLAWIRQQMRALVGNSDNDAPALQKFRRLFELGRVPELPLGHHYGVTLGLRTGDLRGPLAEYGNLLGFVWGVAIGRTCPWIGKGFASMAADDRERTLDASLPADLPVARGINYFNEIAGAPINRAGNALLAAIWPLTPASPADHERWGHEREGGHFVCHRAPSVYAGSPREVLRLDYRYATLGNQLPLPWLIDELVEIAAGIYLGQLVFATAHLHERYDPREPAERAHYQHFGYFLLFDGEHDDEARRLFPHLEIPRPMTEPGARTTLTLDPDAKVDPGLLDAIRRDLAEAPTVLDMIKAYSDELQRKPNTDSPVFAKLHALFNAGLAPARMDGFYYGALVSWQSQGLLAAFDVNALNIAWQVCRPFSPWTGKRFDPVTRERLAELTDGYEDQPETTQLCANTVAFRTLRERAVHGMMKAMHLWIEDADERERREHGYDATTFFFIGKPATSVAAANQGKRVYQFNYRWKPLRNPPPDFLCIDELVQIAEGLFLGQVYYSTKPLVPWNPDADPGVFGYELFEYFLLMDERWQARRLRIGFDLDNVARA